MSLPNMSLTQNSTMTDSESKANSMSIIQGIAPKDSTLKKEPNSTVLDMSRVPVRANEIPHEKGDPGSPYAQPQPSPSPPPHAGIPLILLSRADVIRILFSPQWGWSKTQCRAWLIAVGLHILDYTEEESTRRAEWFDGSGPNLWASSSERWKAIYGPTDGNCIYSLLLGAVGVVPQGLVFSHRRTAPGNY